MYKIEEQQPLAHPHLLGFAAQLYSLKETAKKMGKRSIKRTSWGAGD